MKTKVSQKEWNDKRDAFLCAITNSFYSADWMKQAIKAANELTSELYEVEENGVNMDGSFVDDLQKLVTQRFVIPANSIKEGDTLTLKGKMTSKPTDDSKTTVKIVDNVRNEVIDTRPFNPKVVEIFNEFLPKEIAPLAVEAHKIYFSAPVGDIETDVSDLEKALGSNVVATFKEIDDFYRLWKHTKHNTITATPEQLREWFPQAYEGGENE